MRIGHLSPTSPPTLDCSFSLAVYLNVMQVLFRTRFSFFNWPVRTLQGFIIPVIKTLLVVTFIINYCNEITCYFIAKLNYFIWTQEHPLRCTMKKLREISVCVFFFLFDRNFWPSFWGISWFTWIPCKLERFWRLQSSAWQPQ